MGEVRLVNLSGDMVPYVNTAKYIEITSEAKMEIAHTEKRVVLDMRLRQVYWLFVRRSKVIQKIFLFKTRLRCVHNSHL